ncbi:glycosyltransferase, family 1 [Campylobacter iguaniorum]|uniref:Glycosyltransferase, family 1 n=1 Tax=Campylobacter iguaniorum TaxID=1244531 RepID=A0A076F8C4_9BACT|nr:glycosyltransferase [Campylobacter iguaniorum]AII13933.1 glycosyltransferase, family 1 [Campylobacter iguaniorum]
MECYIKPKIYYLTRSYHPYQKGGGPLMRNGAVKYLQELGYEVIVVMPNYNNRDFIIENNIWQIPFKGKYIQKLVSFLERIGFYEDYLDKWVCNAFEYLKDKVSQNDIVFATSGGELGTIKLGSILKNKFKIAQIYYKSCRFIINLHDPIDYTLVHGKKLNTKFHISREAQEQKYLSNSDLIITSSKSNQTSLISKYPEFKDKIKCNYFGYIEKINIVGNRYQKSNKLKIAYIGNMSATQKPEILYQAYKRLSKKENIEIYFIGNYKNYKPLCNIYESNVHLIDFMPHKELLKFMTENIDIGFVSLANDYLGACVPSKIYEYINLELPMIGALPSGDGMEIINNNNYGIACKYYDTEGISDAILKFSDKLFLEKIRNNIIDDKHLWAMSLKIKEVDLLLKELIYEN